jgi:hypothetical protein
MSEGRGFADNEAGNNVKTKTSMRRMATDLLRDLFNILLSMLDFYIPHKRNKALSLCGRED